MTNDEIEKEAEGRVEAAQSNDHYGVDSNKVALSKAQAATEKEHKMTVLEGIKTYPRAIAWSMVISLCIVMEAFDVCLLNNFCKEDRSISLIRAIL